MKVACLVLVAASCALAQHGGSGGARAGGGGSRAARSGGRHFAPPPVSHPVHGPAVIVPYPVFYGVPYYCDPAYCNQPAGGDQAAAPAPANNYYDDTGAPGQSPVVVMNQSFQPPVANPVMHDYTNTPIPPTPPVPPDPNAPRDDQPTIFLIAMTDHTILPAIAYWVDGDTLNYITQDGDQNRVSLALVDREFSKKLNADRGVEFRLPAAK